MTSKDQITYWTEQGLKVVSPETVKRIYDEWTMKFKPAAGEKTVMVGMHFESGRTTLVSIRPDGTHSVVSTLNGKTPAEWMAITEKS